MKVLIILACILLALLIITAFVASAHLAWWLWCDIIDYAKHGSRRK